MCWSTLLPLPVAPSLAAQTADALLPLHHAAMERLAAGDTAAALDDLRRLVAQHPDHGPGWLRLGAVLGARAGEVERAFGERMEARQALERALRLLPDDPEVLLEYGLVLLKQQMRGDAKRVLDRAWQAAERRGDAMPLDQRARLHYSLGKIYQTWWEDWENLLMIPPVAQGGWSCGNLLQEAAPSARGFAIFAVACPRPWRTVLPGLVPIAHMKDDEYRRMLGHFRLALQADPGHVDAAVALLGHLADAGEWEEYVDVARRLAFVAPQEPRTHLFAGLGLHERGHVAAADSAFSRALALLAPDERRIFEDIRPLLPRSAQAGYARLDGHERAEATRLYFTGRDPLYLTPASERQLEHYARVAWAELKFGAPASGLRGWDTARGELWIRYGRPELQYMCCYGDGERIIYWSYDEHGPNFAFQKALTYRRTWMTEETGQLVDDLRERLPELYRPRTVTAFHELPHQLARFRGDGGDVVRVEVYGAPPLDSLGAGAGAGLEAGIFVFDALYRPIWTQPHAATVGQLPIGLTYRFDMLPGAYRYALEARVAGPDSLPRPVARARETLEVTAFPAGRISISDLLLADRIEPRIAGPEDRDDLVIAPRRRTTVAAGEPVHFYFEVYGVTADADGYGRFRAELAIEGAERRNVVGRLIRGIEELFRGTQAEPTVQWERVAAVRGDQVMDYLTVELATREPGEYAIRLRVTDLATGEDAEVLRRFTIEPADR